MKSKKKYNLIIGRHCLVKYPNFLIGALKEALSYDSNALMIHSGNPKNSFRIPLENLKIKEFKYCLLKNNIDIKNVIAHGPYIVNLANISNKKIFSWSTDFLKKEINRMEKIGIKIFVIHPGSSLKEESEKSIIQISKGIDFILENSKNMIIALETMSGRGGEIGKNFEQIKKIISNSKKKKRIGVCWDTCHLYSSGYDIKKNLEKVINEFDKIIGLKKLLVIHINDSRFDLGEKKDIHENIGLGKIGLETLKKIIWHKKLEKVIKILETPRKNNFEKEIKILKSI